MASILDTIKQQFKSGAMYTKLIMVNVAVFLFFKLLLVFFVLMQWDNLYVEFNGVAERVILEYHLSFFSDPELLITHPWGIITYMFMHANFWHLFSNMITLFFLGRLFEQYLGPKKMLSTYFLSGLAGAVLYFAAQNTFPLFASYGGAPMVGASASVMGIIIGIATYAPNVEVFLFGVFRIRLFVIALLMAMMDILSLGELDQVAHFAHLGGAIFGFVAMSQFKKGKDISRWFDRMVDKISNLFTKKPRLRVEKSKYRKKKKSKQQTHQQPPRNDHDYNAQKADRQAQLDAILDKIKEGGYECLSKQEKDFLANF